MLLPFFLAFLDQTMAQINEKLILLGDFDAGSLYNSTNQFNLTQGDSSSTRIYQLSNTGNSIVALAEFPSNNSIPSLWQQTNDQNNSIIILNGDPYIYSYDSNALSILNGWDAVEGAVSSLYYDDDDALLYLGGDLTYNNTYGAIFYDYDTEKLGSLAFGGFNKGSKVDAIEKYYDSIIFGGDFYDIGESQYLNSTSSDNSTISNSTSNIRDVSQLIPIKSSNVTSSAGSNAQAIICPNTEKSETWTLPSDQLGYWDASLQSVSIPSKLRLYNSKSNDEGVSLFRVITSPANGIMNMTYIDPETLELKHCDAYCPLLTASELSANLSASTGSSNYESFFHDNRTVLSITDDYQDFGFIDLVDVESIQIQIMGYYGSNAALNGVELFRSGITVFADNSLNQQSCTYNEGDGYNLDAYSEKIGDTEWLTSTDNTYLYTTVPFSDSSNSSIGIKYYIGIPISGKYDVLIYTTGCEADNTCDQRGIVNATLYEGDGTQLASILIYQTNEEEKYDTIYSGEISYADSPAYIEMTFESSLASGDTVLVAGSVEFDYLQLDVEQYFHILNENSNIELNGIFEYSLNNFSLTDSLVDSPVGKTDINMLGSSFDGNASITNIAINDTAIIISGDFSTDNSKNIIGFNIEGYQIEEGFIELGNSISIPSLSGAVEGAYGTPEELVLFGSSGTISSLKRRASGDLLVYDGVNSSMSSLDVNSQSSISQISGFTFNDTEYLIIKENDSSSVFDLDSGSSFQETTLLNMNLTSSLGTNGSEFDSSIVMGNIVKFDVSANNILDFSNGSFSSVQNSVSGVTSGAYINDSMVAIGGDNVYSLINNKASSLISGFSVNGSVNSLMYYDNNLYMAFNGTGSHKNKQINGISVFDMNNSSLISLNSSISGNINSMVIDPEFDSVIVGGNFTIDGKCSDLCTLETDSDTLFVSRTLKSALSGTINYLNYYQDYQVLVGGDFNSDGHDGYLGIYDTSNGTVQISSLSSDLPGAALQFIFANETKNEKNLTDELIVLGENYLGYFENSKWTLLTDGLILDSSATLNSISLVEVDSNAQSFFNNKVILLTGNFEVEGYGVVSSAYYDGQKWTPFIVTASNLNVNDASVKSVVKYSSIFVLSGSFTSTKSSTISTTSSTSTPTATTQPDNKRVDLFSSGQVVGVSLALAIGTTLLLGGFAWLLYTFTGSKNDSIDGIEEKEEKMMDAVPPKEIM